MVTVSVVMPVYNTPVLFLREAVDSILNQTFQDFECIIVDDGSTNDAGEYLDKLTDPRVRLIRNETNLGITKSLNIGFRAARGKYIARMDGDDISFPERFEKQIAFMEARPDMIACGTRTVVLGEKTPPPHSYIEKMENYRIRMLFRNPGPFHSTAFFDREKLIEHRVLYDEQLVYAQDYGMWLTASQYGCIANVPEVLQYVRKHPDQISQKHRDRQIQCDQITQRKQLERLLDAVTDKELQLHYFCSTGYYKAAAMTPQAANWYRRLLAANKKRKIYDQRLLKRHIEAIQLKLVRHTVKKDMPCLQKAALYVRYLSPLTIGREIRNALQKSFRKK